MTEIDPLQFRRHPGKMARMPDVTSLLNDAQSAMHEAIKDMAQRDDANVLYQIAMELALPNNPDVKPGLDVALKAALRANELAGPNPAVLATVAHVYFVRGDLDKAIEFQTKAVATEDEDNENKKTLAITTSR